MCVCTIALGDLPYLLSVVSHCVYDLNVTCKIQLFASELQANSDKRIVLPKWRTFLHSSLSVTQNKI